MPKNVQAKLPITTATDAIRRHRFRHNRTGSHRGSSANRDSGKQGDVAANPDILLDNNILIKALRLIRFSDITDKYSDDTCVVASTHRKVLGNCTMTLADELGVKGRNTRIGPYADSFTKKDILIVTHI